MLFDTSVIIDYLRHNEPNAAIYVDTVRNGLMSGYCSTVTEAEIFVGTRNRTERARAESLLSSFNSIALTSSISRLAGDLLRTRSEGEIKAHFADALIPPKVLRPAQSRPMDGFT